MKRSQAIKEIKQLKELLDSGVLTQDEYDEKAGDLKKIIMSEPKGLFSNNNRAVLIFMICVAIIAVVIIVAELLDFWLKYN